ncbi:hypothetical protein [Flavobacterium sp. 102]|jgi:hypothetical protein|uniref:hypothetical protein n=1 Tax=Flavobacterium sp. 102 TaxID=2135623 RepID=UPI000EB27B25|nr:hypothetical protein [Flavobacterium sp. 102]RKS03364.1 hypothetical protein C8C84_3122 [Flavobacterium sp. 102]
MSIKAFMNANSPAIKELVVKISKDKFDSHEFIKLFMKRFEPEYIGFLAKYPKHSHRIVNSQIARNLYSMKDLNIQKIAKVKSESVFGNEVKNQEWQVG